MQAMAASVPITPAIKRFALEIVRASRPEAGGPPGPADAIRLGASPRAAQAILRGAKVLAIVRGRCYVASEDVITMAYPALDHRLVLDMRASSRGLKSGEVIKNLIDHARKQRLPESGRGTSILTKGRYAND